MKKLHIAALGLALAFGLCACGGEKVEAPSEAPVETTAPTATPTASPEATATPTPTPTPSPTAEPTPEPMPTPTAKATPAPMPKAETTPKPKADNKPTNNTNSNQNVVLPVEPSEDVSLYEYYEEVGVAENVPGAEDGKGQKFVISFEQDSGEGDTGGEVFDQIEQWAKEGY